VARAGGVPIMALLSVIPARGRVGRAAPPQPAVGSSRARGWGKGRRSGHGAGPEGGGNRNAFGVGVDWAVWPRVVGRWRPICPALLLGGLALRGWLGGAMGGRQDE
jgi:hypothetical protein